MIKRAVGFLGIRPIALFEFYLFYITRPLVHAAFYIGNGEALGAEKLTGSRGTSTTLADDIVFLIRFEFFVVLLQGTQRNIGCTRCMSCLELMYFTYIY